MEISIKDYASLKSISPQAVYQAIAKNKLKFVSRNGKKWVVVEPGDVKPVKQASEQDRLQPIVKDLMKQLKKKDKEIKSLTKQLLKCSASKESVLLQYIQELKQLQLPIREDEVLVKVKKKKKNKKKRKWKL